MNLFNSNSETRKKDPTKKPEWIKFSIITLLYLIFLVWVQSWLGLIVLPFIFDAYITKRINWTWWRDSDSDLVRGIMSWVDAIIFALVAVYFVNLYFFQNYEIPSSSLEKSLLVGDYLFVSKMSYGPRVPQTPLTMPLTQHTMPVLGCKSYIEFPQWEYRRVKGFGKVELNDIVVFNYPAGDTVALNVQDRDFYKDVCLATGYELHKNDNIPPMDSLSRTDQRVLFDFLYNEGKKSVLAHPEVYGEVVARPVDRRENYVKRCVGLPGQTLQIKDRIIYLDGKPNKEPDNVQYSYLVRLKGELPQDFCDEYGITLEDRSVYFSDYGVNVMPLTERAYNALKNRPDLVEEMKLAPADSEVYPLNASYGWTRDNYGPIWIPAKGKSIDLNIDNIAIYERPIRTYEGNKLEIKGNKIFINGKEAKKYTFKMDYYWMMGDNRHNSADSRYWGFVPEDHIVGKPIVIWLSINPEKGFLTGIRWNRLFKWVDNIK